VTPRWVAGGTLAALAAVVLLVVVVVGGGAVLEAQASCSVTTGGGTVPVAAGQTAYVRTIVGVGKARGVPERGWVVALVVALQESGLRNLSNPAYPTSLPLTSDGSGANGDSLGLFQQDPQAGWGTVEELMSSVYAATAFFGGPDVPPANPGLLDVPGWVGLPVAVAAQRVQRSAYPDAYARWEAEAAQLAAANADAPPVAVLNPPPGSPAVSAGYTGADGLCGPGGVLPPGGATGDAAAVIAAAQRWLGTPYSWGGGTLDGPSEGFGAGAGIVGFDCSSYTRYAFFQGAGLTLPRTAAEQYAATAGRTVETGGPDLAALQPGDLLFWGASAGSIHHVALYAGGGMLLEEPHPGLAAELVAVYGGDFYAATRPLADTPPASP